MPGDGRSFDLDALNWHMWDSENGVRAPNALTISRPSERRRVGPGGLIETVGSGLIARDFTPAGAARGLLIEPQTTNLARRSGDLANAAWGKGGATVVAGATAPDGVQAFGRITEGTAAGQHYVFQNIGTLVIGDVLTITAFVRATGIGPARHVFLTAHGEGSGVFNPATGAVVSSAGVTASVKPWGPGVYRVRATITKTNTTGNVYIGLWNPAGNNSYTGDGVSCVDVWGVQVEKRSTPTSYMPTGASTAVRYADGVSTPITGLIGAAEGGLYIDCQPIDSGAVQILAQIDDGTNSNKVLVHRWSDDVIYAEIYTAGVSQGSLTLGAHTGGDLVKVALGWAANSFAGRKSGGSLQTDASVTPPSGLTTLRLGSGVSIASPLNGYLRRVAAFPTRAIMSNTKIGELVA